MGIMSKFIAERCWQFLFHICPFELSMLLGADFVLFASFVVRLF